MGRIDRVLRRGLILVAIVFSCLLLLSGLEGADSPFATSCHQLAQKAIAENRKEAALQCVDYALLFNPDDRECKLLKVKIEKGIEIPLPSEIDLAACCEVIRTHAMAHPNLLARAMGMQIILEFRSKDSKAASALCLCLNEGAPSAFNDGIKDFKAGRKMTATKRKAMEPKLAEHLSAKARNAQLESKDRKNIEALVMAALAMDPENALALLVQAFLIFGFESDETPGEAIEDKELISQLLKKAAGSKKTPQKQKLFVRIAEAVDSANDDVLLELSTLEEIGTVESLDDLVKSVANVKVNLDQMAKPQKKDGPKKTASGGNSKNATETEYITMDSDEAKYMLSKSKAMTLNNLGLRIDAIDTSTNVTTFETSINSTHYKIKCTFKIEKLGDTVGQMMPSFGISLGHNPNVDPQGRKTSYLAHLFKINGKKLLVLAKWVQGGAQPGFYPLGAADVGEDFDMHAKHDLDILVKDKDIQIILDGQLKHSMSVESEVVGGFGYYYAHCTCLVSSTTIRILD